MKLWNRFWFSAAPYFDLAVMRILIVGFSMVWLFGYTFQSYHYVMNLPEALYNPFPALKILLSPLGWGVLPDPWIIHTVFWLTVFAGALAFIGLFTNVSLFLFALGNVFMQAYIYAWGDAHHREAIMVVALMVFAFSPCGKLLSIDYWRTARKRGAAAEQVNLLEYKSIYAGWAIKVMQCFFPLMYLSAVTSKLSMGGLDWANGYTLQYYLIQDGTRRDAVLPLTIAQYHVFIYVLQHVVIAFQATFWLIVPFPKLRWIYLPLGLIFHLGIWLSLGAPFWQWVFLYTLYIPWSQAIKTIYEHRISFSPSGELNRVVS